MIINCHMLRSCGANLIYRNLLANAKLTILVKKLKKKLYIF